MVHNPGGDWHSGCGGRFKIWSCILSPSWKVPENICSTKRRSSFCSNFARMTKHLLNKRNMVNHTVNQSYTVHMGKWWQTVHNVQSLFQVTFSPSNGFLFPRLALLGWEIIKSPWPVALRDQNHWRPGLLGATTVSLNSHGCCHGFC